MNESTFKMYDIGMNTKDCFTFRHFELLEFLVYLVDQID